MPKINYHEYIRSPEWRGKHKGWLDRANHKCSALPFLVIGKTIKKKYYGYEMHHTNYHNLGHERYWYDVLPLSNFFHDWIIHGILSGFKSAGKQKNYPNLTQRLAHNWCRLPNLLKLLLIWLGFAAVGYWQQGTVGGLLGFGVAVVLLR